MIALLNTLETAYGGDFLDQEEAAVQAIRAAVAGIISPASAAQAQRPWLKQYLKSIVGRTDLGSDAEMLQEMYRYMQTNAVYVASRNITFGSPSAAAANTGNGQILRLTRDKYNFPIESEYIDSKRAICVADENSGVRRGQEVFDVVGQARARDEIERSGSGLRGTLTGLTADDSILQNAGFRSPGGASPTTLTNWFSTAGDGASFYSGNTTTFFRSLPSDAPTTPSGSGAANTETGYALQFAGSTRLQQKLFLAKQTSLSDDLPYLMAVVWNRNGSSGTLNIRMGSITTTVSVSAQSGWQVTTCPSPVGFSCWYRNFAQADIAFEVEWIQTTSGLLISEVILAPGVQALTGGAWYWALPATGTYAQWRVRDQYTWPDIASTTAKNQTWIHRAFPGFYLPSSNVSSVTFSDIT